MAEDPPTAPEAPDRAGYALSDADADPAFATQEGESRWAGPDVEAHLLHGADDPARLYVGLAADEAGTYHATVERDALDEGEFHITGAGDARTHLGYRPLAPRRPVDSVDWLG